MSPRTSAAHALRQHAGVIGVCLAVLLGVAMRVAGWTWGLPAELHPDESVIVDGALDLVRRKSFEPSVFFRPDHVEIQLGYLAYSFYSHVFLHLPVEAAYARYPQRFLLISRAITTVFGVAVIVLAYLIGRRFHRNVGLIAAVVFALFPPFVEHSQYATPDVPLTATMMVVILACMHYLENPRPRSLLVACAATSVGIALKYPALLATPTIGLVVAWAAVRDHRLRRILSHGALSIAAVVVFLFIISPVLFTNAGHVVRSFRAQGSPSIGTHDVSWGGNLVFYAHAYLMYAGVLGVVLAAIGLAWVIGSRVGQAIPLVFGFVYWLALSVLPLHWERWALPMYVTTLLLASIGAYYGFLFLRERAVLGRWLVPLSAAVAFISLANLLMNSAPFATRAIAEDTRLSFKPRLDELGVTRENAVYEGYTPLLPNAPKFIFTQMEEVDGRLVPIDPSRHYAVESSCMKARILADPRDSTERAFYRQLEAQAPVIASAPVRTWRRSWFEPVNIVRAPPAIWSYLTGGHSGCRIDVRRLDPPGP